MKVKRGRERERGRARNIRRRRRRRTHRSLAWPLLLFSFVIIIIDSLPLSFFYAAGDGIEREKKERGLFLLLFILSFSQNLRDFYFEKFSSSSLGEKKEGNIGKSGGYTFFGDLVKVAPSGLGCESIEFAFLFLPVDFLYTFSLSFRRRLGNRRM